MSDTEQEVKKSISSIYASLLQKREEKRERKAEKKRQKQEEEHLEEADSSEETPMTKKEKRQAKIDAWKEVIIGLTGDDLDYVAPKKSKKKYRKWIDDEMENSVLSVEKPKKKKKRNYRKEFEPEINMLKNIVAEQNKFTVDLQKRYQHAAGPNTRDSMPLNKTLVELASVINASRSNSLGLLREIGNIKKTIADLYMKQFKLDQDSKGEGFDSQDLGLMGSSIASSLFGDNSQASSNPNMSPINIGGPTPVSSPLASNPTQSTSPVQPSSPSAPAMVFPKFDPSTWDGGGISSGNAKFEAIPHTIVVEVHKDDQKARFKAIRNDTGEELVGAPVPTGNIKAIDMKTKIAKDDFDQVYPIELVG